MRAILFMIYVTLLFFVGWKVHNTFLRDDSALVKNLKEIEKYGNSDVP